MGAANNRGLVIAASKGPRESVYFVGPFGARVSFASQQRRAFNLVWALRTANEWPGVPQPRAAVIGGGIAGICVAVALRLQGCAVRIFESEGSILSLQSEAIHRFVHPTINFWPELELSWTTQLPVFDWYAAACPTIIKSIYEEWEERFEQDIADVVRDAKLVRFGKPADDHVKLVFENGREEEADFVFVTTGFGPENDLIDPVTCQKREDLKSYWDQDYIDRWTNRGSTQWVVSGTGDGGVIDALRLTYQNFMSEELALQVLYACDSKPLREAVAAIEHKAQEMNNNGRRAKFYAKKYTEIATHLPKRAKNLLPDIGNLPPVTMIGRHDHPFDLSSAPIHKIILALSLQLGHVHYRNARLEIDGDGNRWLVNRGSREALAGGRLIVRHGATPPIWGLLSKKDARDLQARQRQLGDYLDLEGYSDSTWFDHPPRVPNRETDPQAFAQNRAHLAREILRGRFKVGMQVSGGRFQVVMDAHDRRESSKVTWPLPRQLFGIDLLPHGGDASYIDHLTGGSRC